MWLFQNIDRRKKMREYEQAREHIRKAVLKSWTRDAMGVILLQYIKDGVDRKNGKPFKRPVGLLNNISRSDE